MEFVRNEIDALYHKMIVDAIGAQSEYNEGLMAEEPNSKAREFYDLLHAAEVHIGARGQDVTVLLWMSKNLTACPVCGESHYELRNMSAIRQKDVPRKSLWYLPITPRLQRLYMSRKIVERMIWHLKHREDADEVIHPTGSEAWKHFDETHPTFAKEPRNVRLGLSTNGFNPFGCFATPYSCWPIFLMVYNLPLELCMKLKHIFLAMIIAGPKSPGKNIDVMLRPLIDELKELWTNGVETYDSFRQQNFIMKAALLWIISDFLDEVWGPLTKISNFFRALTAPIIQVSNMKMWEENIVETICKLEKVFPPAFCDSIKHLAIHLPYEAKVGGPVQFRWMYLFERKWWFTACKIRVRTIIDTSSLSDGGNVYYQDDEPPMPQLVQPSTVLNDHVSLASQEEEQVVISKVMQLPYVVEEECVGENDDEEEEFDGTETSEEEYPGDDATMEEDTEEHDLEAEFDAEFAVLDPELDAQLEEELSRVVPKTGRGMDKGDDASTD
ncbi:hypothetical protein SLEP1_g6807 [Rubroshorea leprosula]|uniref:DUF4218 domain-containing protein n=1 Tax=Rubroshorea leprosula TaxID=152421 RepID=A0AAV5I5L3_9ROSI|nr:hypothetical protein SLEP1_g6807 [Rubroshorea leprosula]